MQAVPNAMGFNPGFSAGMNPFATLNGTLINPYNVQNENFIELLFKQALNNGWQSISILTLIHCYFYLSLGKIKELFEYFNLKVSQHGKHLLETSLEKAKELSIKGFNLATDYFGRLFYNYFLRVYEKLSWLVTSRDYIEKMKHEANQEEKLRLQAEKERMEFEANERERHKLNFLKKENSFIFNINLENMTDMMAISNSILGMRDKIVINTCSFRKDSNREKATENFVVPNIVEWTLKTNEGNEVQVRLQQDIGLKLNCETDTQYEVLKNCTTTGKSGKVSLTQNAFHTLFEEWYTAQSELNILRYGDPIWTFCVPSTLSCHNTNPANFFADCKFIRILAYLFLNNNKLTLLRFLNFLSGKDNPFYFRGITYTCTDPTNVTSHIWLKESDKQKWLEEFDTYVPKYQKYWESKLGKETMDKNKIFFQFNSTIFDPAEAIGCSLVFTDRSNSLSIHDLSVIGRNWISKQIHDYYNQQNQRVDNRISIYKIGVKYHVEKVDVTNPKYIEWLEKNNMTEDQHADKLRQEKEEKEKKEKELADEKLKIELDKKEKEKQEANKTDKEKELEKQLSQLHEKINSNTQTSQTTSGTIPNRGARIGSNNHDSDGEEETSENIIYMNNNGSHYPHNHHRGKKNKHQNSLYSQPDWNAYAHGYQSTNSYTANYTTHSYQDNTPPAKTIKEDKYIPEVVATLVKSDKKPLEYLYLPEEVNDKLINYLKTFKESRSHYDRYGFPYRGGILLSGVPGCGKSTTILATATYLDKDIYYLDLGVIRTNSELKLCMDYIKGSSKNGAIVIFEDIDCMSTIVLQRFSEDGKEIISASTSVTQAMKTSESTKANDTLSLSFLLNVLDGTMSPENVIFIMTTNFPEKLDRALIRPGRIDISIQLKKCSRYQIAKVFKDLYERPIQKEFLDQFPENTFTTAEVILHLFYNKFNKAIKEEDLLKPFLKPVMDNVVADYPRSNS